MATHFPKSDVDLAHELVPPDEAEPNEEAETEEYPPVLAVGIDLGTSKCTVAGWHSGAARVYSFAGSRESVPSAVAFDPFHRLFGNEAMKLMNNNPENTVVEAKLLLGKTLAEVPEEPCWPFALVEGANGDPLVEVTLMGEKRAFRPQELCAASLGHMKRIAQRQLGCPTNEPLQAVVTIPASFNQFQRQATKDAAAIAGLDLLQLIPKPTAAAVHYAVDQYAMASDTPQTLMVFNMGAGFCEAAAVNVTGMVVEVIASDGVQLGGRDLDACIFHTLAQDFHTRYGSDLMGDKVAVRRLLAAAQRAKHTLTVAEETSIELEALHAGVDFFAILKRSKVEALLEEPLARCVEMGSGVWEAAKAKAAETSSRPRLVLNGGCCRMPALQKMLSSKLLQTGEEICLDLHLEEAAAQGAATQAASAVGCTETTPSHLMLFDITAAGLGLSTTGGAMTTIIPRGATVPIRKEVDFSTHFNRQPCVLVEVYEGQEIKAHDNELLMMFELSGVPCMGAGEPRIAASFDVDRNGILTLEVVDTSEDGCNEVVPLVSMRRLGSVQISESVAAEATMHAADEEHSGRVMARAQLEAYAGAIRQCIRAPLNAVRMTEEKEMQILEARQAAELGLEKAEACLAAFPFSESKTYEEALSKLLDQTNSVVPLYVTGEMDFQRLEVPLATEVSDLSSDPPAGSLESGRH